MRLIGDIHCDYSRYLHLVQYCDFSVQLGDLGYDYSLLDFTDPAQHKILLGNHDNYAESGGLRFLSDYGDFETSVGPGFYVRGAYSKDRHRRTEYVSYFPEEEVPQEMWPEIIDFYLETKPAIVLTHDCPLSCLYLLYPGDVKKTNTNVLLENLFQLHQPLHWYFGHHHRDWKDTLHGTSFQCIKDGQYIDVDWELNGEIL